MKAIFKSVVLVAALGLILSSTPMVQATPAQQQSTGRTDTQLLAALDRATGGQAQVSRHAETGKVRFIAASRQRPIERPAGVAADAGADAASRAFLQEYAELFGLRDAKKELEVMSIKAPDAGRSFVRYQQVYKGVPVLAGEMIVQTDSFGNTISANGEILPGVDLSTQPAITAAAARATALGVVLKSYGVNAKTLTVSTPQLWIYNPALLGGPGIRVSRLVWRVEVSSNALDPIRELVLVDAQRGGVALNFNQVAHAKERHVCDRMGVVNPTEACSIPAAVRSEGEAASGIADVDNAYDYSGVTYDFFKNRFGRDSLDGKGLKLLSTVRYCPSAAECPFGNAFWNGQQMVYGSTYASADDVVGHELAHGVTDFTSHLLYYYQSGAINESLSDVFGELVDQSSALGGNDAPAQRWLMGEALPIGAIRNMANPPAFNDPDRVLSPIYHTDGSDSGGVHINSGVNNKAAFLLVDGGTFNGRTVTKLGSTLADSISKVAKLYYEVEDNLLSSGSDYQDLFDYMRLACANLVGTRPPLATTYFVAANCTEVTDAVLATQMNLQPNLVPSPEAQICPSGQVPVDLFWDDLENISSGNWVKASTVAAAAWTYPQNPAVWYSSNSESGKYNFYVPDHTSTADATIARTAALTIPSGNVYLRFDHQFGFEYSGGTAYDGGVVEYSINNGTTWLATNALPTLNGYNVTLDATPGNPLAGRAAFGGASFGYRSTRMTLNSLVGKSVKFRFRVGSDATVGNDGWWVDDIRVYSCVATPANPVAPNKLSNRGFEFDWDNNTFVDGWTSNDRFTRSTTVKRPGGLFSGKLYDTAQSNVLVTQKVPVTAGTSYKFVGWSNVPATADAFTYRIDVRWLNAGNGQVGTINVIFNRTTHTNGVWAGVTKPGLVAPAGATQAEVRIVGQSLAAPIYVDDFYFGP